MCTDKSCFDLNTLTDNCRMIANFYHVTDKTCFDLKIALGKWQMIPDFTCNWQICVITNFSRQIKPSSRHPSWQLTEDSKFYMTSHVLILTSILSPCSYWQLTDVSIYFFFDTVFTTNRWIEILIDHQWIESDVRFSYICPVIDHEFHYDIVKVAVYPQGECSGRSLSITRQMHKNWHQIVFFLR